MEVKKKKKKKKKLLGKTCDRVFFLHDNLKWTFFFSLYIFWQVQIIKNRSSHCRCSVKKGVLWNPTKFTGKNLCQILYLNKVAEIRPATLLKRRLWHRYLPVNFATVLKSFEGLPLKCVSFWSNIRKTWHLC